MTLESIQKIETQIEYHRMIVTDQARYIADAILANANRADLRSYAESLKFNTDIVRELERDLDGTRQAYLDRLRAAARESLDKLKA